MATSPWRLPLDRAVRYAVSDALASVKSHVYDLEYTQRRSPQELMTWNNYLVDLRALHQLLLNLPSLETAQWLTDNHAYGAPTFTPFVHGLTDARTSVQRVYSWLLSLPQETTADNMPELDETSVSLEQQQYIHQIYQALNKLQLLPTPGSDDWYNKYQPTVEKVFTPVTISQHSLEPVVA